MAHWDDPTQWDVGEFTKARIEHLEGLPLKSGTILPGGPKTGTPAKKEASKQLEKRVLKANTIKATTLVHNVDYPLWRILMIEQLTPFGL